VYNEQAATGVLIIVLIVWFGLMVWIGWAIGQPRGRGKDGIALSLICGPLGWLITCFLPRTPEAEARQQMQVDIKRRALEAERRLHEIRAGRRAGTNR